MLTVIRDTRKEAYAGLCGEGWSRDETMKWLIFQIGYMITSVVAGIIIGKYANSLTELIIYMAVSAALIATFWIKLGEWWYKRKDEGEYGNKR